MRRSWQKRWQDYKDKPEYRTSAFPFPPKRKNLFEKLHDDFFALVILVGLILLAAKLLAYAFG